ncbi:MAG: AbrB/MazE/SpoVT family DNA-binding domain-containing protein [Pyrinomonadaceae bacterium]|nr:AbrB/MazE/SpoVT family DNA-binding domain-containing protein [Pyrinomonadaceae bacterium]
MRVTSKGQVTIPIAIRNKVGIFPDTEVEFGLRGDTVTIKKAKKGNRPTRGEEIVAHLKGRGAGKMTTDEIMSLMRGWDEDDIDR